jgi:hypothetical protein
LPQYGRRLKGRSERTRRRGHESFKAIRKIAGTGIASVAVMLASIWLAGQLATWGRVEGGFAFFAPANLSVLAIFLQIRRRHCRQEQACDLKLFE